MLRVRVYFDGCSLYYGTLNGTSHKWLNLEVWCARMLPGHFIDVIHYFTARVADRPHAPGAAVHQDAAREG